MNLATRTAVVSSLLAWMGCAEPAPDAVESSSFKVRLVANKDSYTLPTGGKALDEYRAIVEKGGQSGTSLPAPQVDLVYEITNTGTTDLDVAPYSLAPKFDLHGPGTAELKMPFMNCSPPPEKRPIRIAAGQTYKVPMKHLGYTASQCHHLLFWTRPGDYELKPIVTLVAAPAGKPLTGRGAPLEVTGDSVKVKVVEGDERNPVPGKAIPPEMRELPAVRAVPSANQN